MSHTPISAPELLTASFPEPRWVVSGLLPEGLTLLTGRPGLGKTWLALGLAVAVASGDPALGGLDVEPGPALYLALDDDSRTLQVRLRALLGQAPPPPALDLSARCPRLDQGGARLLGQWVKAHPDARLIVVDSLHLITLAAFARLPAAQQQEHTLATLALLARHARVALLVVHHARPARGRAAQPLDPRSGGTLVLRRDRGSADAELRATHPDLPPAAYALRWANTPTRSWRLLGNAEDVALSDTRQAILAALHAAAGPLQAHEVARVAGLNRSTVRVRLRQMAADGQIVSLGHGRYMAAPPLDYIPEKNAWNVINTRNTHHTRNTPPPRRSRRRSRG